MSKVLSMKEAVAAFVQDGKSIAMGCALEGCIPFAAGHEILRQGRRNLTLIGPISDMLFDQMIGGGAVRKIVAAWVGNVSTGIGYHFRRAVEKGMPQTIEVENHSNFTLALALHAGSMGTPFAVTRTAIMSDIAKSADRFSMMTCPFSGDQVLAVKALNPDVAVIHAQTADEEGNVQFWGSSGVSREAALAADHTIVVVEELVETDAIRRDPNRTFLPGFAVSAVVVEPWGAHPSPVQGHYGRHHACYVEYSEHSKTTDKGADWLDRHVYDVQDRFQYMELFPAEELNSLKVSRALPSGSVEFGF